MSDYDFTIGILSDEFDPSFDLHKKTCDNPRCNREVGQGVMYCCSLCAAAHEGNYSPEHTASCDLRLGIVRDATPTEGIEVALYNRLDRQ